MGNKDFINKMGGPGVRPPMQGRGYRWMAGGAYAKASSTALAAWIRVVSNTGREVSDC